MRYIITQGQLHSLIYKFLDKMFEDGKSTNEVNPYNKDSYNISLFTKGGSQKMQYFYYGEGEYDDETKHFGIGTLHIHPDIVDTIRQMMGIRETKVVDVVSDWFTEKFEVDVDDTSIYPNRKKPPVY